MDVFTREELAMKINLTEARVQCLDLACVDLRQGEGSEDAEATISSNLEVASPASPHSPHSSRPHTPTPNHDDYPAHSPLGHAPSPEPTTPPLETEQPASPLGYDHYEERSESRALLVGDREGRGLLGDREGRSLLGDREGRGLLGEREGRSLLGDREGRSLLGDREGRGLLGDREGRGLLGERGAREEDHGREGPPTPPIKPSSPKQEERRADGPASSPGPASLGDVTSTSHLSPPLIRPPVSISSAVGGAMGDYKFRRIYSHLLWTVDKIPASSVIPKPQPEHKKTPGEKGQDSTLAYFHMNNSRLIDLQSVPAPDRAFPWTVLPTSSPRSSRLAPLPSPQSQTPSSLASLANQTSLASLSSDPRSSSVAELRRKAQEHSAAVLQSLHAASLHNLQQSLQQHQSSALNIENLLKNDSPVPADRENSQ
ncbi:putative OAR domain-containing protein 1 [Homarus americanus]|uniref:Putative OAR domain-containing protein 1 n=1 Tax=Homarus americanus TaxID=6706 RepID=A0A8J5ML76_HOMAM|nr:putative OAR domain-containing protein 1 [Homarus americanus]